MFLLHDYFIKTNSQAERPISTGELKVLPLLHLPPINLVVFQGPSYAAEAALGALILGKAWRLDAFSAYPFQTWLHGSYPWQDSRNTRGS